MASTKYKNIYLTDYVTLGGPLERESHLKNFDFVMDDYYYGEKTFEQAEIKMQGDVIDKILEKNALKNSDVSLLVGGDLNNQIADLKKKSDSKADLPKEDNQNGLQKLPQDPQPGM